MDPTLQTTPVTRLYQISTYRHEASLPDDAAINEQTALWTPKTFVDKAAITQVPLKRDSLNQHNAFVLDTDSKVYVWFGKHTLPSERSAANTFAELKQSQRGGDYRKVTHDIDDDFWLWFRASTMEMVGVPFEPKLYLVSREGNESYLKGFLKSVPMTRDSLNDHDVFVLDSGRKIYVWIGEHALPFEKINANLYADREELKRGGDPATVTHDADDTFWELLDGTCPICEISFNSDLAPEPASVEQVESFEFQASVEAPASIPPYGIDDRLSRLLTAGGHQGLGPI